MNDQVISFNAIDQLTLDIYYNSTVRVRVYFVRRAERFKKCVWKWSDKAGALL